MKNESMETVIMIMISYAPPILALIFKSLTVGWVERWFTTALL
jgi:hypothetical protein